MNFFSVLEIFFHCFSVFVGGRFSGPTCFCLLLAGVEGMWPMGCSEPMYL